MNNQNIFFIFCLLFCFIVPLVTFNISKQTFINKIKLETSVIFIPFVCLILYSSLFWSELDFISDTSALKFISPFLAVVVFSLLVLFLPQISIHIVGAITLSSAIVLGFDYSPQIISSQFPILNQLLLITFWCFISFSFRILNILSEIIIEQLTIFCLGIYILKLIGCAPDILGFIALCVGISSLVITIKHWPQPNNFIANNQADILGFMLGAFIVNGSTEGLTSPLLIFILLPLCEILLALLKKITFISLWNNIYQNTSCAKALSSGLSPQITANYFLRTMLLLIVIGCFQIFASNQYSLLTISSIICCWQMYRLSNWQDLSNGWIDSSKKVKKELKASLRTIKQNLKNREE